MTLRELFSAIQGFHLMKESEMKVLRDVTYGASKWNAMHTAFSKEQARSIKDTPLPWDNPPEKRTPEESKKRIEAKLKAWQNGK